MDRYLESLMVSIRRKQFPETVHTTFDIVSRLLATPAPFAIPGLGSNIEEDVYAMVDHYLFNVDGRMPTQMAELELLHIAATTLNQLPSPAALRFMFARNMTLKQAHFCKLVSLAFSLRMSTLLLHATMLLEELRPDHVLRFHVADVLLTDFGPPKKQQQAPPPTPQQQQQLQSSGTGVSVSVTPSSTALAVSPSSSTSTPSALACLLQLCPRLARLLVGVLMAHRGRLADEVISMAADWVAADDAPPPIAALARWCLELHGDGHYDPTVTWKLHLAIVRRVTSLATGQPVDKQQQQQQLVTLDDVGLWLEAALHGGAASGATESAASEVTSMSTTMTTLDMLAQMLQAVMSAGLLKCDPGKVRQAILPHCPVQNRLLWRVLDVQRPAAGV